MIVRILVTAPPILAAALGVGGCAGTHTTIQPDNPFPLAAQADITKPPLGESETATAPSALERLLWHRAQAIQCSDKALRADGNMATCKGALHAFSEAAITASNESCDKWFDWLVKVDVESTYVKNAVNIGGNAAQALMGLTGDSPTQIAKVALALGVVNSGFDNYRAVFLMTNTLHKVRATIGRARTAAAGVIRSNLGAYQSWDELNADIAAYHKSCSRETILEILDAGVGATAYVLAGQDTTEIAFRQANQELYLAIYGSPGQFSEGDLKTLSDATDKIVGDGKDLAGLAKSAQARYAALAEKGKSDFKRWLETITSTLKARKAATQAAADRAEEQKQAAILEANRSLHTVIRGTPGQFTADELKLLANEAIRITGDGTTSEGLPSEAKQKYRAISPEAKQRFKEWLDAIKAATTTKPPPGGQAATPDKASIRAETKALRASTPTETRPIQFEPMILR